jgi:hypothetical protein
MSRNRFKSILLYVTAGIALLVVFVGLLFALEQRRTQTETGAVLSAFFSQGLLHDAGNRRNGRTVEIVILRDSHCFVCSVDGNGLDAKSWFAPSLRSRGRWLSNVWFAQSSRMTRANFFLNSVSWMGISTDLQLPNGARATFITANDLRKTSDFETGFPDSFGYFVLSHVGLNLSRTEALLYVEHFCGGFCAGGEYVLMRKVDGAWHVVDHLRAWLS